MHRRFIIAMAAASLVLVFGAPNISLACHLGSPHDTEINCNSGATSTDLVLEDATGKVVGEVFSVGVGRMSVIVGTPAQGSFLLEINRTHLESLEGFTRTGSGGPFFENLGCPSDEIAYLPPLQVWPNAFREFAFSPDSTTGSLVPWVATSFEKVTVQTQSIIDINGDCLDLHAPQTRELYAAEKLTDEFGVPVEDIHNFYQPPFSVQVD